MSDGAIAIVGASCRFPGAPGLEPFWRLLVDGVDAVCEVGDARWTTRRFQHPTPGERGKSYSFAAGLIDDIDRFEPEFFGISPREAAQMDPQQRLLLELAWHALEDAGIPSARLAGSATGVYIGASSTDYGDLRLGDPASGDAYFVTGSALSILASRVSHFFDLRGPSLVIDTACSSSLVALHHACAALQAESIAAALVGGVNLLLSPYPFVGFAQAAMLSRRGRCYAFDARADGYVRGEGGGVVVLKRLERALADGDSLRAVICGTAVSSSGRTIGLSLPSEAAQAELLRAVYAEAGIAPDQLGFVEMHGTGTPVGDPAEAAAVGKVLAAARADTLPIGSVKTNIGHLEPASGMAGLLKAMLALERGLLPRSLYGETPNPAIAFDRLNLRLVRAAETLAAETPYAGVNSFGFGGSNAHAILAAPPPRPVQAAETSPPALLISARSGGSLRALAAEWRVTMAATPAERRPALLRAAARRRDQHAHRLVVTGDDLAGGLDEFLAERNGPATVTGTALRDVRLAFVYSGNGAQFLGMGRAAYGANAAFRDAVAVVDRTLTPFLGWSVAERIINGDAPEEIRRADIAQPMLFAIQMAITTVLRGLGIAATGFVGHSVGEIAAAWAAGSLSLGDAARVVAVRSRHQERMRGQGRMAVLALGEAATRALLADLAGGLEIAAINSARSATVAGDGGSIAELRALAASRGIACRGLDLDFAFHSAAMEPIRHGVIADLRGIGTAAPVGDFVSTVTGCRVGAATLASSYWWRNIRDPVRFAAAATTLIADGYRIFVEIGPKPVLQPYLRDALHAAEAAGQVFPTLDQGHAEDDPFSAVAARLHVAGYDVSGAPWFDGSSDPRGVPLYQWQRRRYWFGRTIEAAALTDPPFDHTLLGFRRRGSLTSWVNHLDVALYAPLGDHRIEGVPVLPAAAILDMAFAAARVRHPDAAALDTTDVEWLRPVAFADDNARETCFALVSPEGDWQLSSRKRLADEPMTLHASGNLAAARAETLLPAGDDAGSDRIVSGAELYRRAARLGLDYGKTFRTVSEVVVAERGRATVVLAPPPTGGPADHLIHPALLDGAFQGLLALLGKVPPEAAFLPRRLGRARAFAPFGRTPCRAEIRLKHHGARSTAADIALFDETGGCVAELVDCWFARVELNRAATEAEHYLRVDLVPASLGSEASPAVLDRLGEIVGDLVGSPRSSEQTVLFGALVAAIALEAVRDLADLRAVSPPAAPLLGRLLPLLQRFGAVVDEDGSWRLVVENDLPDAGELWRSLLAEAPEMVAELALAAMLRDQLPGMLRDGSSFDPGPPVLAALRAAPSIAAGKTALAAALDAIAADWPAGRPLRIGEPDTTRFGDRLGRSEVAVTRTALGRRCDVAVCVDPDAAELSLARTGLVPGGAVLAIAKLPVPPWELLIDDRADLRGMLAAAGFIEIGTATISTAPSPATAPSPCQIAWARAPGTASDNPSASLSLAVVADEDDTGLAAALMAAGHRLVDAETAADDIVLAVGDEGNPTAGTVRLLPLFAGLAAQAAARRVPLWLVTRGAYQPSGDPGLIGAALWGFGRVLQNETPGLTLRLLDLAPEMTVEERAWRVAQEIAVAGDETEIVWAKTGRYVPRLRRGLPEEWAEPAAAVAASSERPGRLDRLNWKRLPSHFLGPGEIEIDVRAAGVNFRDVMWAAGMLPEEALIDGFAGAALGLECAGVVSVVGDEVVGVAVGDRVVGFAPAALASRVVTRADAVIAIPPHLDFAAAATLPVAFVTARYSLATLARLMPGEHVLIHAASGGVGLAAIQIAKGCGAVVIATAGSAAKRTFLKMAGADHVCDSRDLGFVTAVRNMTDGAGVDVVLNSLHGEAMAASLELLKPFGRFVELGKRDFYENRRLRARVFRRNVSYFAVDVDQLSVQRPDLAKALLSDISAALAAGEIRPLAHRRFAFAEIADAFRSMQAAQHIGKIVLVPDDNRGVALSRQPDFALRRDGAYAVTGGIGGFGFAAARWLAEQGAGHIALLGRRGVATPGAAERVAELEALGASVSVHAADVGDEAELRAALAAIRARGAPIRGVVHAAAAIVDGMAGALTSADIAASFHAKLGGAILLDRLTRGDPLDLFWLFSSATTLIGAPGQGAYVAANRAIEALARRRCAEGRPALAIAWGPIADAGVLAARPAERDALVRRLGARAMPAAMALSALPAMAASRLPVIALADTSWNAARHLLPILAAPVFEEVRGEATAAASDDALVDRLADLDVAERSGLLESLVAGETARILRLGDGALDRRRPLAELGMDSLMAVELRLAIEARLRIDLPLMSLADGMSVVTLASRLAQLVSQPSRSAGVVELAARHESPLDPFALGGADRAGRA